MSKVAGKSVVDFHYDDLSQGDRRLIRIRLTQTLEYIRLRGFVFFEPETEQIFYERSTGRMSLVGLSRAHRELFPPEQGTPITEGSIDVLAFGMGWSLS
ncbi:hypothetical protein VTN96DRAFT_7513 [Rasamsonia emersonii]